MPFVPLHLQRRRRTARGPRAAELLDQTILTEKTARHGAWTRTSMSSRPSPSPVAKQWKKDKAAAEAIAAREERTELARADPQHPASHGAGRQLRVGRRPGRQRRDDHLPPARSARLRHALPQATSRRSTCARIANDDRACVEMLRSARPAGLRRDHRRLRP